MKQRIMVAVFGIPALLLVLVVAPPFATAALLVGLGVIGAHELLTAVCGAEKAKRYTPLAGLLATATVLSVFFASSSVATVVMFLRASLVVAVFICAILNYGTDRALTFTDICAILVAGVAIPMALATLLQLRMLPYGGGMVLIPLVAAFCSDSAALFAGMAFGKHKLSPRVSPKKTVEGAIGGLVGGMLGMVIFRIIFHMVTLQPLHIGWCLLLGLVGAVMGQLGDLSFSVIKRQQGIKDYGRLLPGHGGVLDRFDSVIFAAPVVWLIVSNVTL